MSDDLVKRLRYLGDHASFEPHMHHTAADRIDELEAELLETQDRANDFATKEYYTEMRAERAETKLAKAVEALGRIKRGDFSIMTPPAYVTNPLPSAQEIARTTLAELKGQNDE